MFPFIHSSFPLHLQHPGGENGQPPIGVLQKCHMYLRSMTCDN